MLIRRLSLKSVTQDGKLYTCEEWIDEYKANKRSKDLHSVFNGRKVFNPEKGELSVNMVAEELQVHKSCIDYYIKMGMLRSIRKGHYHVILREDLDQFKINKFGKIEEIAENA